MFATPTYRARRDALQAHLGSGLVLLLGNGESPINFADNTYPFRQDSTFLYYIGIASPHLAAILDLDDDRTILFGDEPGIDDIIWMGKQETLREQAAKSGIDQVLPSGVLAKLLSDARRQNRKVHFLPPYRSANRIRLSELLGIPTAQLAGSASVPLIRAVASQRSVKTDEEIVEIERAVGITAHIHEAIIRLARPGMLERELAATIAYEAERAGCKLAYPTILTVRGEVLHNHGHGHTLRDGQLVLNDSGVETALGYAADLTRTFPAGTRFSATQRAGYEVVLRALETATRALAPGVRYLDVHYLSCRTLVEGLVGMGLMWGDPDEAVAAGAHTLFFQCGTGHLLGLDVHDMEDLGEPHVGYTDALPKDTQTFGLKSLRLGRELRAGFVVTVEPGLYFIPELIDRWTAEKHLSAFINYGELAKFRDFGGIRIEDNAVVTAAGHRVLGRPLAKTVAEIEALRS